MRPWEPRGPNKWNSGCSKKASSSYKSWSIASSCVKLAAIIARAWWNCSRVCSISLLLVIRSLAISGTLVGSLCCAATRFSWNHPKKKNGSVPVGDQLDSRRIVHRWHKDLWQSLARFQFSFKCKMSERPKMCQKNNLDFLDHTVLTKPKNAHSVIFCGFAVTDEDTRRSCCFYDIWILCGTTRIRNRMHTDSTFHRCWFQSFSIRRCLVCDR